MNLKQKVKTYSFWISLVSAILIIVRVVCERFNLILNESFIMDIVTGICGVLVLLGILTSPTKGKDEMDENIIEQEQSAEKLNDTIKADINKASLSIAEQIELLSKPKNVDNIVEQKTDVDVLAVAEESVAEEIVDCKQQPFAPEIEGEIDCYKEESFVDDDLENLQNTQETAQNIAVFKEFAETFAENDQTEDTKENEAEVAVAAETCNCTDSVLEDCSKICEQELAEEADTSKSKDCTNLNAFSNAELKQILKEIITRL